MVTLKDEFRAINSESGIVVTFKRINRTDFIATWYDHGEPVAMTYSSSLLYELLEEGYLFPVSDTL